MSRFSRGFGRSTSSLPFLFLVVTALASCNAALAQLTVTGYSGTAVSVSSNGNWTVAIPGPHWNFSGSIGAPAVAARIGTNKDGWGSFQEITFDYTIGGGSRTAAIRVYDSRPTVLFSVTWNSAAANASPFPVISSYPSTLSHLAFNGEFAPADFIDLLPDSPWAYFDSMGETFILSPTTNFMTASMNRRADNSIGAGISSKIATLPAGFTHRTALVYGKGINATFDTWGSALTSLKGKKRPGNDADPLLKSVSYWTDNGAAYYYNAGGPSYTDTLKAVRTEFADKGIRLGSMQLDSWWYPKGPDNSWSSHSGIWTYTASPALFQADLGGFQTGLKTPLVTHARWIDANSPYRSKYAISGNVATDPKYWEDTATYLKASGVSTYEQDWLAEQAHTDFNLTDPEAFLDGMAASMAKRGITIQYCMAAPGHFLQSTNYGNVTTIRASQDRFRREIWTNFFYSSRLASALGVWPFTDVLMSSETNNLIAATLSAGPVGIGDALGNISKGNLIRAVRADGVIVKPDVAATPVDSVMQNDALGIDVPMVVASHSDFGAGLRTYYLFAYVRGANKTITIDPATYGISGAAYFYDALQESGRLINPHSPVTFDLAGDAGYYVLAPVGKSGIAMLGDKGNFVSMGKKRVSAFQDTGEAEITVNFAAGEGMRTIYGFAPYPVLATALTGSSSGMTWDETSQIFTLNLHQAGGKAKVQISVSAPAAKPVGCLIKCSGGGAAPVPGAGQ